MCSVPGILSRLRMYKKSAKYFACIMRHPNFWSLYISQIQNLIFVCCAFCYWKSVSPKYVKVNMQIPFFVFTFEYPMLKWFLEFQLLFTVYCVFCSWHSVFSPRQVVFLFSPAENHLTFSRIGLILLCLISPITCSLFIQGWFFTTPQFFQGFVYI